MFLTVHSEPATRSSTRVNSAEGESPPVSVTQGAVGGHPYRNAVVSRAVKT